MIPNSALSAIVVRTEPWLTYGLELNKNVVGAKITDLEAIAQTIYLILNTERYAHEIYSWDYGVEFADLIGKPRDYVYPEIESRIAEALLVDDRITRVDGFEFNQVKNAVSVTFTVHTTLGEVEAERTVNF